MMLRKYREMDINRMKLKAHIANGGEIEEDEEAVEAVDVHPDAF